MEDWGLSGSIYKPLNSEQIKQIHKASLGILKDVGMSFDQDLGNLMNQISSIEGVKLENQKILFDEDLVSELTDKAPASIILYSRDKQRDIELSGDKVYFAPAGTVTNCLDLDTGERRQSVLEDFHRCAQLVEELDHLDMLSRTCTPNDIPVDLYDINILYAALKGTSKHINLPIFKLEAMDDVFDIIYTMAGGADKYAEKPFVSIHTSVAISPLKFSTGPVLIMKEAIKNNAPVSLTSAPMAGSTAPVTLAGTLTVMHAELMAMVALTQLIKPGAQVILSPTPSTADMSSMDFTTGTMEASMLMAASHQLTRHLNVPNYVSAGWSNAKIPDAQAGWETISSLMISAMAGGNLIRHAAGFMENGMTLSFEHFVMSDYIIGMVKRLLKGIEVNPDTIGLEVIKEVGPGNSFILSSHTLKHMRKELYRGSGLVKNNTYENWVDQGKQDALKRANVMVRDILNGAKSHIPNKVDNEIRTKYKILL